MKRIIKGKLYNTDTATPLGYRSSGDGFSRVVETLYKKKTGEFFLHGYGGPLTSYAVREGSDLTGSDKITPFSFAQAQAWAEEYLDAEDYEAAFGPVPEDDSTVQISLRISATCAETIRRRAAERGMGVGEYIEHLVRG